MARKYCEDFGAIPLRRHWVPAIAVCLVFACAGAFLFLVFARMAMRSLESGAPLPPGNSWASTAVMMLIACLIALGGVHSILADVTVKITQEGIAKRRLITNRMIRWQDVSSIEANGYAVTVRAVGKRISVSPRLVGGVELERVVRSLAEGAGKS
jgi:hypothetical protein